MCGPLVSASSVLAVGDCKLEHFWAGPDRSPNSDKGQADSSGTLIGVTSGIHLCRCTGGSRSWCDCLPRVFESSSGMCRVFCILIDRCSPQMGGGRIERWLNFLISQTHALCSETESLVTLPAHCAGRPQKKRRPFIFLKNSNVAIT